MKKRVFCPPLPEGVRKAKPGVTLASGFLACGCSCGIKRDGKKDLALIYSIVPAVCSILFTKNKIKAAPILFNKKQIKEKMAQAILINSGCANACTGKKGLEDVEKIVIYLSNVLGCSKKLVLVASTGIIGTTLPIERIKNGIIQLKERLSKYGNKDAAEAIMTTDTKPKEIGVKFFLDGKEIHIGGMAKGAGMIHPKLATMLCFITTDVNISKELLHQALCRATDNSFNLITVDGDTSPNDMVIIMANGQAGNRRIVKEEEEGFSLFQRALNFVCQYLSLLIVRDGEGASKLIRIHIKGARKKNEAKKVGLAIANSVLVKTSFFGEHPNPGRIMSAIGNSSVQINPEKIDISFGSEPVIKQGCMVDFSEKKIKKLLRHREISILVDLNLGYEEECITTVNLTPEYVRLNASYT